MQGRVTCEVCTINKFLHFNEIDYHTLVVQCMCSFNYSHFPTRSNICSYTLAVHVKTTFFLCCDCKIVGMNGFCNWCLLLVWTF